MEVPRRAGIFVGGQHVVHFVGIRPDDMAEGDPGELRRESRVKAHRNATK
jgi:hypothetical protein